VTVPTRRQAKWSSPQIVDTEDVNYTSGGRE
jgi:hypothetical protein